MEQYDAKRFSDPIHGTMGFSELEVQLIDSRAFQRLRNIKHLGLAHYVFPGADFSRFSHSLGVCHLTGRIFEALKSNGVSVDVDEIKMFRLAGLLHDIGHYPFSHALENPIADRYAGSLTTTAECGDGSESGIGEELEIEGNRYFKHERLGKLLLEKDPEISRILKEHKIEPVSISKIFLREDVPKFDNLISADFDADRIDYLMRAAHYTGLPYGDLDLDYLLSQLFADKNSKVCLKQKALRAADHFLLSRYFQYQQVVFNKTVRVFEQLLKDIVAYLLKSDHFDWSATGITAMVHDGKWYEFDDAYIYRLIEKISKMPEDNVMRDKAIAIVARKPPALVAIDESLGHSSEEGVSKFKYLKSLAESKIKDWSSEFNIPEEYWHVDSFASKLSSMGSTVSLTKAQDLSDKDADLIEQVIHIWDSENEKAIPITQVKSSLMKTLSDTALYSVRVYLVRPFDRSLNIDEIRDRVNSDLLISGLDVS